MSTNTSFYDLVKQALTDFYDRVIDNSNLDKIDAALKGLEDNKAPLSNPTFSGTPKIGANNVATTNQIPAIANNLTETAAGKTLDATQGKALAELIGTKAAKSSIVAKTLSAASWTGSAVPFSYSLTVAGVTTTSNQEILPTTDITEVQLEALQLANIIDGGQSLNTITLKAWGEKPAIDLPIRVILRGDA